MIRRLITGLAGLLVLALGLLGLPAFLIAAHQHLASYMPALSDLPSALLAPGDGGLFLLTLLGIGWAGWIVFLISFLLEVISRARGIRTPRLGPFLPQRTAAWAVTAVTLLASLSPSPSTPHTAAPPAVTASAPIAAERTALPRSMRPMTNGQRAEAADAASDSRPHGSSDQHVDADGVPWRDYRVKRGDTLWDIADRKLDDPTQWPVIAEASGEIRQPSGRHLEDPDLILPGWTLHIPRAVSASDEDDRVRPESRTSSQEQLDSATPPPRTAEPPQLPTTPLRPPAPTAGPAEPSPAAECAPEDPADSPQPRQDERPTPSPKAEPIAAAGRGRQAPATPLHTPATPDGRATNDQALLTLPHWVRDPLIPSRFEDAPTETRSRVLAALAELRGLPADSTQ